MAMKVHTILYIVQGLEDIQLFLLCELLTGLHVYSGPSSLSPLHVHCMHAYMQYILYVLIITRIILYCIIHLTSHCIYSILKSTHIN